MSAITINGVTLDPAAQGPSLAAAHLLASDATGSDYLLVQTKGPLDAAQRAALEATGARILEFVPRDTYVCWYPPADLQAVRSLPFVSWANVYLRGFKINPALMPGPQIRRTRNLLEIQPVAQLDREPYHVDIVLHQNADPQKVCTQVADAAGVDPDDVRVSGRKIRLIVPSRRLPKIADIDGVRHIERVSPKRLHNDVARTILRVGVTSAAGNLLEGDGQVVAVCDTGLDKGKVADMHPAFAGRVVKLYALGRPQKSNDPDGHGTHVAGSVLGDATSAPLGLRVRGTAPSARLVFQSVLDAHGGLGGIPADLGTLFKTPYTADGARVHTNSWSNTQGDGEYNSECSDLDDFVWNHRDLVICFAAGNEGVDSDANGSIDLNSIKPPSTSKNCITVGACENDRPNQNLTYGSGWPTDFPAPPISTDRVADNPDGVVAFSSRGPTLDQRIKPDLVAPGTFILSTRSRDSGTQGWGLTADPLFFFEGGTSMATPLAAGCAAVIREFLVKEKGLAAPSAALVKAMLVNGARDMVGQYVPSEAAAIPNNHEGFGRIDVAAVTAPPGPNGLLHIRDEGPALDTGQEQTLTLNVPAGATSLKATLVWTDPAGEALQNDLDLVVRADGNGERHGNQPATSTAFDRTNNIEQVVWEAIPAGSVDVIVRCFRAAVHRQPYALVVRIG